MMFAGQLQLSGHIIIREGGVSKVSEGKRDGKGKRKNKERERDRERQSAL